MTIIKFPVNEFEKEQKLINDILDSIISFNGEISMLSAIGVLDVVKQRLIDSMTEYEEYEEYDD